MPKAKVKRPKICSLCGHDAGVHPGRHMQRHHKGRKFEKLKEGKVRPIKFLDTGGGSRKKGHGFKKGHSLAKKYWAE